MSFLLTATAPKPCGKSALGYRLEMITRSGTFRCFQGSGSMPGLLVCFLTSAALFATYFDIEVLDAPFQGLFVRVEEHIKPISAYCTASIKHFYRLTTSVAGNDHFGPKGVFGVGRHESIARTYLVTTGRFAV